MDWRWYHIHILIEGTFMYTPIQRVGLGRRLLAVAAVSATLLLAACGGGGTVPFPGDEGIQKVRALPSAVMQQRAVNYSPYRSANRDTETVTEARILEDLLLLKDAGFGLIRLFDASDAVAKKTLAVIQKYDLPIKVMLGMYVAPALSESVNMAELNRGIDLAKAHPETIVALSVGNEKLVYWSFSPMEVNTVARYIRHVRSAVTQPVTTNDNWAFFAATGAQGNKKPYPVLNEIDFVAMHSYPLLDTIHNPKVWDWKKVNVPEAQRAAAMMDAALDSLKSEYRAVRENLDAQGYQRLPILIGETGWKAAPAGGELMRASPVNQKMYFESVEAWKAQGGGPVNVVHFEAFDEPWKKGDDKWGLFTVDRKARCVAQSLNSNFVRATGVGEQCDVPAAYFVPNRNSGPVVASRLTVYADLSSAGEAKPDAAIQLISWEGTASQSTVPSTSSDGGSAVQITPNPADWGWGMTWSVAGWDSDMTNFVSGTARLNFRIKTAYPGKLEFGFLTGGVTDSSARDVYVAVEPGQYGYDNKNEWKTVSIPVSALIANGKPAYGQPTSAILQMDRVNNLFVIADRYDQTGKNQKTNDRTPILIDDIHWTR